MSPAAVPQAPTKRVATASRTRVRRTPLAAHGQAMLWTTGGALATSVAMILGLLLLVLWFGLGTFWPQPVVTLELNTARRLMGEINRVDTYVPGSEVLEGLDAVSAAAARRALDADGELHRRMLRTGNFELTGEHFVWIGAAEIAREEEQEWALVVERLAWGRFYGVPTAFTIDGEAVASQPAEAWRRFQEEQPLSHERASQARHLEENEIGALNRLQERARLRLRRVELRQGSEGQAYAKERERYERVVAEAAEESAQVVERIQALRGENQRHGLLLTTADGTQKSLQVADVVRAYPANQLGFIAKLRIYLSRWWEFLSSAPREANSEGGVFPAIFGTVVMTLIMSILVVPFGVLAALYLREYAKQGLLVSAVRIAVNNLAGVPSIVFGVFGLGFFCYILGGGMDRMLWPERLPTPTFGKGGLMWASLTLALLTLPVVIVATEEALSAVPSSMREGSYACGATKWQTIRRIVLPRAMPGIMTGMILAIARGAGEVAPLMLVGAVKLAPELPIALTPPFGADRSFMHLGFHIYDLGFQSQNSEAAKPMVFTTTLLLIGIVIALNVVAISVRTRLRRKFSGGHI